MVPFCVDVGSGGWASQRSGRVQGGGELAQGFAELLQLARGQAGGVGQPLGNARSLAAEGRAGVREVDGNAALILAGAPPLHEAQRLEPLEQGRERAGVEAQLLPQFPDAARFVFPEHQHHEVLRVGQAQVVQHGPVDGGGGAGCGVQRKAHLAVKAGGVGHDQNDSAQFNCAQLTCQEKSANWTA